MDAASSKISAQMLVLGGAILVAALLALAIRLGPELSHIILNFLMPNA